MKVQATSGKSKGKGGKAEQQRGSRRAGEQGRSIRNPQSAIRNRISPYQSSIPLKKPIGVSSPYPPSSCAFF
ncbi:MAG: hypothetical protein KAJ81_07755, partial [Candidatus Latescibacteria bacterium]|nr:hypothetical protein [Candidatus Latescibacterota bacterium]